MTNEIASDIELLIEAGNLLGDKKSTAAAERVEAWLTTYNPNN